MLSLKIDNQFIALPDNTEIVVESNNPVFSDAGAKTYLFEIPVSSLKHIIGNANEIYGDSLYNVLNGKRAVIYINGLPFFFGVVNLEDEISIEDGNIAINIASGNLEFSQMIEGMNCRDVEQAEEVIVGYRYTDIDATWTMHDDIEIVKGDAQRVYHRQYSLPDEFTVLRTNDAFGNNITDPYPLKKHCTIRAAYYTQQGLSSEIHHYINYGDFQGEKKYPDQIKAYIGNVFILGSSRRNSGICFFVNYFIQCLAYTLNIGITENTLLEISDFNRLAFVNMRCKTRKKEGTVEDVGITKAREDIGGINLFGSWAYWYTGTAKRHIAVATSENFPDSSVNDVITSLSNGFGIKFIHDSEHGQMRVLLIRDILRSNDVATIHCKVISAQKVENYGPKGFKLVYDQDKNNVNFQFPQKESYQVIDSYSNVASLTNPFDSNVYVDNRNGNAYAIKVDEEADASGDEVNLRPSLFEVGGYESAEYGDCTSENYIEECKIGFSPIINIDADGANNKRAAESSSDESKMEMAYALYIDKEINHCFRSFMETKNIVVKAYGSKSNVEVGTGLRYYDFLGSNSDVSSDNNWSPLTDETEVNSYDVGLMLGIMRGPGSDAAPETFDKNFDGEGNYRVAFTAANYAFTSDSIDNCNRDFDYNGTAEGVGEDDLNGRFSLKLRAGKYDKDGNPIKDVNGVPIVVSDSTRANRGLYDTFWKEYAYFTVNKKIIHIVCRMEIADIINLDWTKRYRIGEWVGFIYRYSFSVKNNGMSEVELDLYYV